MYCLIFVRRKLLQQLIKIYFSKTKFNSMPQFLENYSKLSSKALTNICFIMYNKIIPPKNTTEYKMKLRLDDSGSRTLPHQPIPHCLPAWLVKRQIPRIWISEPIHRTSFWSESKAPADFWCLCVSAFCFADYNWMTVWMGYDFAMASFSESKRNNAAEKAGAGTIFR